MAISTHAELLTAISDYIGKRTDLGDVDDDFVVLCEARLNYGNYDLGGFSTAPLRAREMQTRGSLSVTSEYTTLPTDYLEAIYAKNTSQTPDTPLLALPQASFDRRVNNSATGPPLYYSIFGTELRINPVQSCTLELGYYAKIPALASNDPNWLLSDNPGVYLYGSLLEAALYIKNAEDIQDYGRQFSGLVMGMNASESDSARPKPLMMQNQIRTRSGFVRA